MRARPWNARAQVAGLALALGVTLTPVAVRAAPPPTERTAGTADARSHFQRGIKFYKDADFRSALVEFQEAYRLSPSYRLLFNIGQTHEELGDFAGAVKAFREYVTQGGAELTKARRAEVEKDLARLEGHVATVEITVSEADAEVTAEGERRLELGTSPLASRVLLNGGDWTIRARKTGFDVAEQKLTVAGGDTKKVALTLVAPAPSAPPAPPPVVVVPPPAPAAAHASLPRRDLTWAWVGVAVTGTLGVATGVSGVVALRQKSTYDSTVDRFGASAQDVSTARSHTRTWALATDVLGGATLAAAAVTLVLFATSGPSSAARPRQGNGPEMRPYIGTGREAALLGATGTF